MKQAILGTLVVLSAQPRSLPSKSATDVSNTEIQTVLKMAQTDQQLKVVDIGAYNVGVGILHRAAMRSGEAGVSGLSHNQVTEIYYVVSGAGTLVTGGAMPAPRAEAADGATVKVLVGPSMSGVFQNGHSRKVAAGDVVIIPAGVPHGFSEIVDHIDYLSVRVDPDHVLPAGYVHEAIRANNR